MKLKLNIWISISNEIPTLTVQISVKPDLYSAFDKPQKHTLRGRTSGRSFTFQETTSLRNMRLKCLKSKKHAWAENGEKINRNNWLSLKENKSIIAILLVKSKRFFDKNQVLYIQFSYKFENHVGTFEP